MSARQRGYTTAWDRARKGFLAKHPLCVCCLAHGHVCAAGVVDHIIPHRGDMEVFWRSQDWQALCLWCHNNIKKPLESKTSDRSFLHLARIIPGWLHPVDR